MIPLPKELAQKEAQRLEKEKERVEGSLVRIKTMLSNPEFLEKAKPELIEKQKNLLAQAELELKAIEEKLVQTRSQ